MIETVRECEALFFDCKIQNLVNNLVKLIAFSMSLKIRVCLTAVYSVLDNFKALNYYAYVPTCQGMDLEFPVSTNLYAQCNRHTSWAYNWRFSLNFTKKNFHKVNKNKKFLMI